MLQNIKRRKHPQNTVQKNQQQDQVLCVPDEVDYISLQKEVEILKTDKSALMQELVKLRERHESSQNNLLLLRERLQGMENNQQQLLSFLVMIMQSPGLLSQLFQPKENSWRVAEAGKIVLNDDAVIVRYQPLPDSAPSPSLAPSLDPDKTVDHDVSFDRVKDFLMNFDFPSSPLDESFLSAENYGSIVPTDEFDLDKLEQFLLSSPDRDDTKQDEEETKSALHGIEAENCEMNDSPSCFGFNKDSSSLEHLTEKMEGLSPGNVFL